jgi:parvulin-like peptidyl-prolyl isomerase
MPLKVNGETVTDEAVAQEAQSLLAQFRRLSDEERRQNGFDEQTMQIRAQEWALENLIERTLMRQKALETPGKLPQNELDSAQLNVYQRFGGKEKFDESGLGEEFAQREAEIALRLERLLGEITATAKSPKNKDVAAYYRRHKERWKVPETLRAAHIVKHSNEDVTPEDARKAIDEAYQKLQQGQPFEQLADELSDCPGGGGDLGWFPRGQMVQEFEDVVFELQPGETSEPFQSVFGFHIAKLYERKPPTIKPLAEVKDEIEAQLRREAETKAVEDYVDRLREKAEISHA